MFFFRSWIQRKPQGVVGASLGCQTWRETLPLSTRTFFWRFLWGKDLSSRQLRHQAEGVMFCGMHRLVGKTGVFWKEIFAVALCCTWSLPVRTLSRKMVTQCSTGFVIESFKQSVVWPSARCSIRAMPGRFSSKQSTRDMRQRSADQHKTRQLCFWTNPKCYVILWLILFLRLWKQDLATVWKELFKKDDAYSSRDLMHSHDILRHFSDARSEKMAYTAVTPTWRNRKMRCDPRWPEEGLSGTCQKVIEFSTHNPRLWFILNMIRYCTYVKSWCFQDLGIPEDKVEMLFQSLQPTPGRFTACFCIVYWVIWLVSIGIKCNVTRSERHLIFVGLGWHVRPQPSNFKLTWGNWYGLLSFSGQFFLICRRISRPALFCQARWPLLLPGHFSKTLGEEEAKAPAKAAWEIIEININRLAR